MSRELLRRVVDAWDDDEEVRYDNQEREALMNEIHDFLSTPEPTQNEEPVAWISHNGFRFNADIEPIEHGVEVPLFLHPAPRPEFVRLSEEEIASWFGAAIEGSLIEFARAIEDALKEKNTINKSDPDSIDLQSRCRGDKL